MRNLITFLITIFICGIASADIDPLWLKTVNGCTDYTFCGAQTAIGTCTVLPASGDERVLDTIGRSTITFYSTSSAGAHTCNIESNDVGHDAASGVGFQINATALTEATPVLTLSGPLMYIWIECSAITTSVTVTARHCAANN